jgi:excisionase family DNA binding protein
MKGNDTANGSNNEAGGTAPQPTERWLTNEEACKRLNRSPRTLQNYRTEGLISYSRVAGGKVMYKERDVDALLENAMVRKGNKGP